MAFNNKLYALRKQMGLSQEELAHRLNVSRQTLSKWEVGDTTPDLDKLIDLSSVFNISLDELILDKETPNTPKTDLQRFGEYFQTKVNTPKNRTCLLKIGKYLLYGFIAIIVIELVIMVLYVMQHGIPPM